VLSDFANAVPDLIVSGLDGISDTE
jgi:hypothetical protein